MEATVLRYVRLCKTVNTRGDLVPLQEVEDASKLQKHISTAPQADWYRSMFTYSGEAKEYFDKHGSIKGYNGEALTNKLVFDFDYEDQIEVAKQDTITLLDRLGKLGIDVDNSVQIFYSGGKGFHVEVPIKDTLEPLELKAVCGSICDGLKSFDGQIYNTTRIFRLPNTRHQKTGLYKIELDPGELLECTVDQIKAKAKLPTNSNFVPTVVQDTAFLEPLKEAANKPQSVQVSGEEIDGVRGLEDIDFDLCPPHMPRCLYALSKGIMVPGRGERNAIFLRLAKYYQNQGLDKEACYGALKGIARLNSQLYPEASPYNKDEIWNTVISSTYGENNGWEQRPGAVGTSADNEIIKRYCDIVGEVTDKKCILHSKAAKRATTVKIEEVDHSFRFFAENYDKNRVKTGINFIDKHMNISTGTTTLLVGACGSGKTTVALNIMKKANSMGQRTMFFSLDMDKNMLYLKLAQNTTPYSQKQIFEFYRTKNQTKIDEIRQTIAKNYGLTFFDFSSTLTMEEMRDRVLTAEEKNDCDIRLVVVDYAGRVTGPYSDRYANATYNALKSVEVAKDTQAAWMFISQISRNVGDGSTPLRTKRAAKESGDWEESASNVITVWRPFMGVENEDDVMRMYMAKNRMGKELEKPLKWNGAKGTIEDMTEDEEGIYNEERSEREKELLKNKFKR